MIVINKDETFRFSFMPESWYARLSSVKTPEKLLACTLHLLRKNPNLVSTEDIAETIQTFSDHFGFQIKVVDYSDSSITDWYEKFSDPQDLLSCVTYYCNQKSIKPIDVLKLIKSYEKIFILSWDALN